MGCPGVDRPRQSFFVHVAWEPLVELDEERTWDIALPGGPTIRGASRDVGFDKGDRTRFRSDVLEFNQMSILLNQKSSVQGKVPSGYFNALFDLSGAWLEDAKSTKCLAFDGYFISLYNLHLRSSPLVLREEVKKAVPSKWDPASLCRFIRTFGTHIIVEIAIGGQDVVCVRQSHCSTISSAELKKHLEDLGDFIFSDGRNLSPLHSKDGEGKKKVPEVFLQILHSNYLQLPSYSESSSKEGLSVICSKRGGNVCTSNHSEWLQTVQSSPDAILLKFIPITSLLTGIQGSGYLSHAINLYLRYKPDPEDLQYFLEFQVPYQWAPRYSDYALGPQIKKASNPSLQFRFLGPKLQINTDQVSSDRKLVVGLRLYLEGRKCNRLTIHVQHLSSLPRILRASASEMCFWQGSEDSDPAFIEPIRWRQYSAVCTSTVKHDPEWLHRVSDGVGRRRCSISASSSLTYPAAPSGRPSGLAHLPPKGGFLTNMSTAFTQRDALPPTTTTESAELNSGVCPDGPPVPVQSRKLLKFVDMAEVVRGAHNAPGHWLVTAAKLVKKEGKIGLQAKFALLNYVSGTETISS
ncbi:hypothetical protein C4D60_Mb09t06590 [Musa balbisiana]|uniref:MACPF domain-containing protein n=1 Tax=Musa balbisiana TaxID=52838 RepID=A0A4V6T407_MUSBA|nr:hypothetical protein C4D60_Mb09t06590 [Musa balbisiana]